MGVTVEYVDAPLGHRLHGVNLATPLDDATFDEVEAQFNRYGVIVIPGQRLTPEQQIAFSRRLGALEHYHVGTFLLPGHPEVFVVSNVVEDGRAISTSPASAGCSARSSGAPCAARSTATAPPVAPDV